MKEELSRTETLLGNEGINILSRSHVAVFGIGGVGGHVVEALARSGIGTLTLVDADNVEVSNINRQIVALHSTIGQSKVEVMKDRVLDINPECNVNVIQEFFLPEKDNSSGHKYDFSEYDYVVDAIDTVSAKIELIIRARECNTPIISAMGAGNKLDATVFAVSDIYATSVCPLAKVMRHELRARGVDYCKCVFSKEEPATNSKPVGSIAWVPSVMGLIMAGEVIKDLTKF